MDGKINFITSAILDTQATIRAIDAKLGAVIAGSLLPFSVMGQIWSHIGEVSTTISPYLGCTLGFVFFSVWITSILLAIKTLSAIDNPVDHIKTSQLPNGSFYSGGMFGFKFKDYFFYGTSVKSEYTVQEQISRYPTSKEDVVSELSFEHLKLTYIRDVKLHRLRGSLIACLIWLFFGILIYGFSHILDQNRNKKKKNVADSKSSESSGNEISFVLISLFGAVDAI